MQMPRSVIGVRQIPARRNSAALLLPSPGDKNRHVKNAVWVNKSSFYTIKGSASLLLLRILDFASFLNLKFCLKDSTVWDVIYPDPHGLVWGRCDPKSHHVVSGSNQHV